MLATRHGRVPPGCAGSARLPLNVTAPCSLYNRWPVGEQERNINMEGTTDGNIKIEN